MTTKLTLYNAAIRKLGHERLASLAEASTARYALDDAYDETLGYCLEQGFWNFAMRAVQIDRSASVTPTFGYTHAFAKPADLIRLYAMSAEDTLRAALTDFVDEPNYWFANQDPLFVKYVSDDTAYGRDLSIWPVTFANYVALRLAAETCRRITGSAPSEDLRREEKRAKIDAASKDAMNEPAGFLPGGTWVRSRGSGANASRWDGTAV
jgi:hypothetical protein